MPFTQKNDNTRVQKPLIVTPIKRKLVRRTKNEEIRQDNRPQIIRQQAQSKSDQTYKQQKMEQAQAFTGQAFTNMFNLIMPSHLLGIVTSNKPLIETIGNPEVRVSRNELANFLLDMISPSDYIKAGIMAIAIPKALKDLLPKLAKGESYVELLEFKGRMYPKIKGTDGKVRVDLQNPLTGEMENIARQAYSKETDFISEIAQKQKYMATQTKKQETIAKQFENLGIDLSPKTWFAGRPKIGPGHVTNLDTQTFMSHLPEYMDIYNREFGKTLFNTNGWEAIINGRRVKVDPAEYIVAQSKAFKNSGFYYDGVNRYTGMSAEKYNKLVNNEGQGIPNWTSDNATAASWYANNPNTGEHRGRVVKVVPQKVPESQIQRHRGKSAKQYNQNGWAGASVNNDTPVTILRGINGNQYYDDASKTMIETIIYGNPTRVKALKGNNGNFEIGKGLYSYIESPNNNKNDIS